MSLKDKANVVLEILRRGSYVTADGRSVSIEDAQNAACEGSRLYTPKQLAALCAEQKEERADAIVLEMMSPIFKRSNFFNSLIA